MRVVGIATLAAHCPAPLMIVYWGGPDDWQVGAWRARLLPRRLIWDRPLLNQGR